jgi:hypothetical protein
MSIEGYIDYQRREFCNDIHCPVQILLNKDQPNTESYNSLKSICQTGCLHSCHEFHLWLISKGYLVIRPA